jgi:hypothetical protein
MSIQRYQSVADLTAAVKAGVLVCWVNDDYHVEDWPNGGLHIVFQPNRHAIGLTKVCTDCSHNLSLFFSRYPGSHEA